MSLPTIPSLDLRSILMTAGVGSTTLTGADWEVYSGNTPASPNQCIAIYDFGGIPNPKWLLDEVFVAIRVRGDKLDYVNTATKIQAVKDALLGMEETTAGNSSYKGCIITKDIFFEGYDDSNRPLFTLDCKLWREPANSTGSTSSSAETNRTPL